MYVSIKELRIIYIYIYKQGNEYYFSFSRRGSIFGT